MILTSNEPELGADAITVMDRKGRPYLDPSNPGSGRADAGPAAGAGAAGQGRGSAELDQGGSDLGRARRSARRRRSPSTRAPDGRGRGRRGGAGASTPPSIAVNQPADLGEPRPLPSRRRSRSPSAGGSSSTCRAATITTACSPTPIIASPPSRSCARWPRGPRIRSRAMVRPLIPASWTLDVGTIPDDVPTARPAGLAGRVRTTDGSRPTGGSSAPSRRRSPC